MEFQMNQPTIFNNRNPQYDRSLQSEIVELFPITDDHSRVVLDNDEADSDYINANYVPVICIHVNCLMYDCSIPIANALEIMQSCT